MDTVELLSQYPGKNLEFRRDFSTPKLVLQTIAAFANTAGGMLLIGVDKETRNVCGVADAHDLGERVARMIAGCIDPVVLPDLSIRNFRGEQLLMAQIYPSGVRPHYIKEQGLGGGVYVRVGPTNQLADAEMIEEMKRYSLSQPFDASPMAHLSLDEVDFKMASEQFAKVRQLKETDLEGLRLAAQYQNHTVPTAAGILLFGRNRLAHFPAAWIQAKFFAGITRTECLDMLDIKEPLIDAIDLATSFVKKHTVTGVAGGAAAETADKTIHRSLPPEVVGEAIVNAVAHTDYSQTGEPISLTLFQDRLEIENPGLLPFGMLVEDLPHGIARPRNSAIGGVLQKLGLMHSFGTGVPRMLATCREAGLAPPVWAEVEGLRIRLTLSMQQVAEAQLDETDQQILNALAASSGMSTGELVGVVKLSLPSIRKRLKRLAAFDLVHVVGVSQNDPRRKYVATRFRPAELQTGPNGVLDSARQD